MVGVNPHVRQKAIQQACSGQRAPTRFTDGGSLLHGTTTICVKFGEITDLESIAHNLDLPRRLVAHTKCESAKRGSRGYTLLAFTRTSGRFRHPVGDLRGNLGAVSVPTYSLD